MKRIVLFAKIRAVLRPLCVFLLLNLLTNPPLLAAEVVAQGSKLRNPWFGDIRLELATNGITPMKVRYLDEPFRVIFEFEELDFSQLPADFGRKVRGVSAVNFGNIGENSRLVLTFDEPQRIALLDFSAKARGGKSGILAEFEAVPPEEFAALVEELPADRLTYRAIENAEGIAQNRDESLPLIVIDPGHGGIDPGAVRYGVQEKDVTLQAAKTIAEVLRNSGRYEVVLTREGDQYASLLARRQFAERVGADILLSIHADTVEIGDARGTTIYKLSDAATSQIAAHFAHFENRVDLFAGENLPKDEQDLSLVLADLAHKNSREQAEILARALQQQWQSINALPEESRVESAAFAVLKAPEIPSLLLEIGYLSNSEDVKKILNPNWLQEMAQGILSALDKYYE